MLGFLAQQSGSNIPISVCRSPAGYYIGTIDENGLPLSRESAEYFANKKIAEHALLSGDFTQRFSP